MRKTSVFQNRWLMGSMTIAVIWFMAYAQGEYNWAKLDKPSRMSDFGGYYTAALVAKSSSDRRLYSYTLELDTESPSKLKVTNSYGRSPDPNSTFAQFDIHSGSRSQYVYPPLFAGTLIPLAMVDHDTAQVIWHILCFLFGVAALFLAAHLAVGNVVRALFYTAIICPVLLVSFPMADLLACGNVSSLIAFLMAAGIWSVKRFPRLSSLAIALAVFIKLTPIVLIPVLLLRRQWSWLISFCVWSAILLAASIFVLGIDNHIEYVRYVVPSMSGGLPMIDNRSLQGLLSAAFQGAFLSLGEIEAGVYSHPSRTPIYLSQILSAIAFAGGLLYFWHKDKGETNLVSEMLLVTLWSLLFSPVTWRHGYILAVFPVVYVWLLRRPAGSRCSYWYLVLSLGTVLIFSNLSAFAAVSANSFWMQICAFLLMPAGVVLVMACLIFQLQSGPASPDHANATTASTS